MTTTHRRIALLAGASVSAIGLASPALAAHPRPTGVYPGVSQVDNTDPVTQTLEICGLADDPLVTPDCFYGVVDVGPSPSNATVNSVATGQIEQRGNATTGPVNLLITNSGDAEIGAIAIATTPVGGFANAVAYLSQAILQTGTGPADVNLDIVNNGDLLIDAYAEANGTNANATAHLDTAIYQYGNSTGGDVTLDIDNNGVLTVAVTAIADGDVFADADAYNHRAIQQEADVLAGDGNAVVTLDNAAGAVINFTALASAVATEGNAMAFASVSTAIQQDAYVAGLGVASAAVNNAGAINIAASAVALGGTNASASAYATGGISQSAYAPNGGDAVVTVNNALGAVIDVEANATAVATSGSASANVYVSEVVSQFAQASEGGNASAVVNNAGAINATGMAVATGTTAYASAGASRLIEQTAYAFGGGDALVEVVNDGTLSLQALATANVGADDTAAALFSASAYATVSNAITQYAYATGGGDATARIDNNGALDIAAIAVANGATFASAYASVTSAINQDASAYDGGNALVSLTNGTAGDIAINAQAFASATSGTAFASASNTSAIRQNAYASGGGDASALMNNAGAISITAAATAIATGYASAEASVSSAITQQATAAGGGNALVSLTNSGAIGIGGFANASGSSASAFADVDTAIRQSASAYGTGATPVGGDAVVNLVNTVDGVISIVGTANAVANGVDIDPDPAVIDLVGAAYASADVSGIEQFAQAYDGGNATVALTNAGAITVAAAANATGITYASADASVNDVIRQDAFSDTGNALASLTNSGSLLVAAAAAASATDGSASADASIFNLVYQEVDAPAGTASAFFSNVGTISASAVAVANAASFASASASVEGIEQDVDASVAVATLINDGTIALNAAASANGSAAFAYANVFDGVEQDIDGATVTVVGTNSAPGVITMNASAVAVGTAGPATALAYASSGWDQSANAGLANLTLTNNGQIALNAFASASGAGGVIEVGTPTVTAVFASAYASAYAAPAMVQRVTADTATVSMVNNGSITVAATAVAVGNGVDVDPDPAVVELTGMASAFAYASGLNQDVITNVGDAIVNMTNDGSLVVTAVASASAPTFAFASASAYGAAQTVDAAGDALVSFVNGGTMSVAASAFATAEAASAYANAIGYELNAIGNATVVASNTGEMNVSAIAAAPNGYASAVAQGMVLGAEPTFVFDPVLMVDVLDEAGFLNGTVVNDGTINVVASASGTTSFAQATGILVEANIQDLGITNSGTIAVDAITANGVDETIGIDNAEANGIVVRGNGTVVVPAAGDLLTVTNDGGTIIVRESGDGGATFRRGTAIDVTEAPVPAVINLLGDGAFIYGNIDIEADDVINVQAGDTRFDGIINPECLPAGGPTALTFDNPAQNACGVGVLNINNGGNLILANDPDSPDYDGPAYVFVDTFNMGPTGTITFELPPVVNGQAAIGTYPQVFTDVANLDGTLVADIEGRPNGLFFNSTLYNNVIDATDRNGTFDQCIIGVDGFNIDNSVLLEADCIYDAQDNVDIGITRVAFDDVPGLNGNGLAVGFGLECIYDPNLTGGIADLIADLFLITDEGQYNQALNQLSGAGYAGYLQSFASLGVRYNDILDHATSCEIPALAGSVLECRTSPVHVWGQLDFQARRTDGDENLGSSDADRWTAVLGVDFNVGGAAIVGASIGRVTNRVDFDGMTGLFKADGFQLGAYGVFDPGAFYVKALGTYNWFDGDSSRAVDFGPFGGTFAGDMGGDPDVRMWTLGLHGGARLPMGATSVLTPYLNLDHTNAKLKSFDETGLDGANLSIYGGKQKRTTVTGGVKFASEMGGVVPELNLGYRYMFGDRRADFRAAFLDDEDCAFDIVSAGEKRGSLLAGLTIGGKVGPVDVRVGYQGVFNSDARHHAGNFRIILPFGGAPAPAPAPMVMAPPPPPPPPAPVEMAPPPPPPPPPAPSGERGE